MKPERRSMACHARLSTPCLFCSLYAFAALGIAGYGISPILIGVLAVGIAAAAWLIADSTDRSSRQRQIWTIVSVVFTLGAFVGWLLFGLPTETALASICLLLITRGWAVGPTGNELIQIWLLSLMLLHVSAMELSGLIGVLLMLGWGVSTIQVLNIQALLRSRPGVDPYSAAPRSLSSSLWVLPVFILLSGLITFAAPRLQTEAPSAARTEATPTTRMTGLGGGAIDLNDIGRIEIDSREAFRIINPPSTMLPQIARFRADVLDEFVGLRWGRSATAQEATMASGSTVAIREWPAENLVRYEVRMSDQAGPRLPVARRALTLDRLPSDGQVAVHPDGTVNFIGSRAPGKWYVVATNGDPAPIRDFPTSAHLVVPAELIGLVEALSERIFDGSSFTDPALKAQHAAAWFRRHGRYTLDLSDNPRGAAGLAHFLGHSLAGHCELFATAQALVMRQQGIPSRVVIGWRGGEYRPSVLPNAGGPDLVITNEHAHAWVEGWVPSIGWIELEATPVNELGVAGVIHTGLGASMATLRMEWSRLGAFVDTYDHRHQQALWAGVRQRGMEWLREVEHGAVLRSFQRLRQNLKEPTILLLAAGLLLLNLIAWRLKGCFGSFSYGGSLSPRSSNEFPAPIIAITKMLQRRGLPEPTPLRTGGAAAYIRQAVQTLGGSNENAEVLARLYTDWRFGLLEPTLAAARLRRYHELLRELESMNAKSS